MNSLKTGEVVLVDLGMRAKVRPCLVLSPEPDSQRDLVVVAPLTREIRGGECEVAFPKPRWLNDTSVINVAGLLGVEFVKIEGRLGSLSSDTIEAVKGVLTQMFDLKSLPAQPAAT